MTSILDLDPELLPSATVGSVAMLRNETLKSELAGFAEKVWSDLALLKVAHEDAVWPSCQQAAQIGLAH